MRAALPRRFSRLVLAVLITMSLVGLPIGPGAPQQTGAAPTWAEFPGIALYNPGAITVGPGDDLWFTQARAIGRLSTSGTFTDFPINCSGCHIGPDDIVYGPDGNFWFTESGFDRVTRMTPAGVITEFSLPVEFSEPRGIAVGSDGNIWFTEAGLEQQGIGRITPTGTITEFVFPDAICPCLPYQIVAGPDNNLWFTDWHGERIGKIEFDGDYTFYDLDPNDFDGGPQYITVGPDGALWFTTTLGEVARIDPDTGEIDPPFPAGVSGLSGIATGPDGNLWITSHLAVVVRMTTAGVVTAFPMPSNINAPQNIIKGQDNNLWFVDRDTHQIWRMTTAGVLTPYPEQTVVDPAGIIAGPDGNMWFAIVGGNAIGKMTPTGEQTTYPLATSTLPEEFTIGPDNNLWFTMRTAIGRLNPQTGVIDEFPVPNGTLQTPFGIAAGSDGNIWFTQLGRFGNPDLVRSITTAGVLSDPITLAVNAGTNRMVAGPDGNLWFLQSTHDKIVKLTTAGVITEYPLEDCTCFPQSLTVGPDNNLWITEAFDKEITRVTTSGVTTEFPIPNNIGAPFDIAAGSDGALWFTSRVENQIARMTTTGQFSAFTIPTPDSDPYALTFGPDGNIWFTEKEGNAVGRLTPGEADLVTLTLTTSGTGTVDVSPDGTVTGPTTQDYEAGTEVTLTPQPGQGQTFTGWMVDGVFKGWANPLTITMDEDHAVEATFVATVTFDDVTGGAVLVPITELASRGYILGYGNGRYGPSDPVQRAQMAALISRATPEGPGSPTNGYVVPPACVIEDTWDCEDWGNTFTDRGGIVASLWRNAGTLQHYQVALGYTANDCAAKGRAFPCYGPTDPVSYVQTIAFITRGMIVKGYWVAQPNAPLPYSGVPGVLATEVKTFAYYTGGVPDPPSNWNGGANRGWFARALWAALNSYWGLDDIMLDTRPAGGYVP